MTHETEERGEGRPGAIVAAVVLYALVHSALASRATKDAVARLVGERIRDGWYRLFYNTQAVAATGALGVWAWRQPDRTLYATHGVTRALLRGGQLAGAALGVAALRETGVLAFAGAPSALAWLRGGDVPPPMEAQGPRPHAGGPLRTGGAFTLVRHPLNVAFAAILWCSPRMTVNLATFASVSTLYLLLGSVHEERRLLARHGAEYARYRTQAPFFVPRLFGEPRLQTG